MKIKLNKNTTIPILIVLAFTLSVIIYLFEPLISNSDNCLFVHDYHKQHQRSQIEAARHPLTPHWSQMWVLGNGNKSGAKINLSLPILATFPKSMSPWINIGMHILFAAIGAWYCARAMGIGNYGAIFAGIAFGLTGHFVTLINAGHIGKLQCIPWIPWTFAFFLQGWQKLKWQYFLLAACAFSLMWLSGEPQVPYYLGIFLALYTLMQIVIIMRGNNEKKISALAKGILLSILCLVATLAISWQGISHFAGMLHKTAPSPITNLEQQKGNISNAEVNKEKQIAAYDFSTSWSYPPAEVASFFMSGKLFGVQSPTYWGKRGTKKFHMTQVDHYMGFIVMMFMLFGIFARKHTAISRFMIFMMLLSLLIAFGRFTPFYRLIYALPTMASQRIPARWIALTAFSIAMLAGKGLERFLELTQNTESKRIKKLLIFPGAIAITGIIMLVISSALKHNIAYFAVAAFGKNGYLAVSQYPQLATQRAVFFMQAFSRTGTIAIIFATILAVRIIFARKNSTGWMRTVSSPIIWTAICLTVMTVDLARNDKQYIPIKNAQSFYKKDAIVSFFTQDKDLFRIQILGQNHPYINMFNGYLGPWFNLRFAEHDVASRGNTEFTPLFNKLSTPKINYRLNPRYFDIFNVKYVLSGVKLPPQLLKATKLVLKKQFPFQGIPPIYIYEYTGFSPNPESIAEIKSVANRSTVISTVANPSFNLSKELVGINLPDANKKMTVGNCTLNAFDRNRIKMTVNGKTDHWIVLKEAYDPDWNASIDGEKAELFRVNGFHIGIPVPAGKHEIIMKYKPSIMATKITLLAWIIAIIVLIVGSGLLNKHQPRNIEKKQNP